MRARPRARASVAFALLLAVLALFAVGGRGDAAPVFTWPSATVITQPAGTFVVGDANTLFYFRPDVSLTTNQYPISGVTTVLTNTGAVTQDAVNTTPSGLTTASFTAHTQSLYSTTGGLSGNVGVTIYCVAQMGAFNTGLIDNFATVGAASGSNSVSFGTAGYNASGGWWSANVPGSGTADHAWHLFTTAYDPTTQTAVFRIDGKTQQFAAISPALNLSAGLGIKSYYGSPYTPFGHVGPTVFRSGTDSWPMMAMYESYLMSLAGITPGATGGTDQVYVVGNSRATTGFNGITQWDVAMASVLSAAGITPAYTNQALGGVAIGDAFPFEPAVTNSHISTNASLYVWPFINTGGSRNTLFMVDAVNDLTIAYQAVGSNIGIATAEQAWARTVAFAANYPRGANSKLVMFTVMPETIFSREWMAQQGPRYNNMMRSMWPSIADGMVDAAALPMGAPCSNGNWNDCEHLSTQGAAILGAAAAATYRQIWNMGVDPGFVALLLVGALTRRWRARRRSR